MKLTRRLFMLFAEISPKNKNWVSEPHFGEVRVTHDLSWWLVEKPMVDFLFALIELFSLLQFRSYMCTAYSCFHTGLTSLHSYFTGTDPGCHGSSRINHCWHQKLDTGLPDGGDRIRLCSLVLTQCRSVTDGLICRGIYSACKRRFFWRRSLIEIETSR